MENLKELIENKSIVVVDLETSGLDKNRDYIIEVGAVKIKNGVICDRFSTLAYTLQMTELPQEVEELTGIKFSDLQSAPSVDEVLQKLYDFANGCTFVAHNAPFDMAFLGNWGFWCAIDFYTATRGAIDTVKLAREVLGGKVINYKLSTLAEYFGIEFTHHRALDDAEATAKIFLELAKL